MISGWKTKWGLIIGTIGGGLMAGAMVAPSPDLEKWCMFIGIIMATIGGGGVGLGVAHKVEKSSSAPATIKEPPSILGNSGAAAQSVMVQLFVWVLLALVTAFWCVVVFNGCAPHRPATQQIAAQTSNPYHLAQAVYLDALTAYNESLKVYLPYRDLAEKSNPAAAARIKEAFAMADGMLADFKGLAALGKYREMDADTFRALLRDISIEVAMAIDSKGGK
ncbi:MAG TPA: hypothetical protein DCZ95_18145 [Verrucomicrobia bacterium]|nr:hypothetical protein [Verrucomicrobiota bacterium]